MQDETANTILTADNITLDGRFEVTKTVFLNENLLLSPSKKLKAKDIFICLSSGSKTHVGKVAFIASDTDYYAGGFMGIIRANSKILPELLFELLNSEAIRKAVIAESSGANIQNLSASIKHLKIPLVTLAIQQQIVAECQVVDQDADNSRRSIEQAISRINASVGAIYISGTQHVEIDKIAIDIQYGLNEAMNEGGVGYKIFRMNEIIRGRMVDNGSMKCADISAEEFAKYKLTKGDLLFIRSNGSLEHIGKVGLFDLDGDYCYASYLVRIVPDSSKVLPRYLGCIMNSEIFRKGMVSLAVKSGGTNNINATKMKNIKVPVPTLPEQKKFVARIEALEKEIADAQAVIDGAAARKQVILQKYL